jgi:protein ImuB
MRVACLLVPDLSLVAALRAESHLATAPLAIVQAGRDLGGRALVLAATPAASCVAPGMTLAEARSLCPGLVAQPDSPERVRAAAQAAVEAACAVSPRVEEVAPGLVHLDATGLGSLFGDERGIARALVSSAERVGLCAAVGIAEGKSVALLAARAALAEVEMEASPHGVRGGAFRVVPREEQAAFLADLPLFALASSTRVPGLDLDGDLVETLQRFGLRTLGEIARLPPGPLAARLGPSAAPLLRIARGEGEGTFVPQHPSERFEEGEELEWDATSLEPLLFLFKTLLDRLCARLGARGSMARELTLHLRLEGGSWDARSIDLAGPSREAQPLLQLLRLSLEGRPPVSGVRAVRLSAAPAREVLAQLPLFGPRTASPTQVAAAVARLHALVGDGRVGMPVAPDTHRPFAAEVARFAPPPDETAPQAASTPRPAGHDEVPLAARALRPPREAEVRCDPRGQPLLVIGEGALGGRVVQSAGPWRTVAEWWTDRPIALDSYDLEIAGGLLLRASRELDSGSWWIEAVYD